MLSYAGFKGSLFSIIIWQLYMFYAVDSRIMIKPEYYYSQRHSRY